MIFRSRIAALLVAAGLMAAPAAAHAQDAAAQVQKTESVPGPAQIIMPHITDSKKIDYPCVRGLREWACEGEFPPIRFTVAGHQIDLSITKHVFFLFVAGVFSLVLLLSVASSHRRHSSESGRPKGFAAGMEAVILYLRNEIYMPVLGHGGAKFVPFCLTLFFFIAWCNLLGLMPWGSTPTGNANVTVTLAMITFFVVEIAGMRALGKGYIGTLIYWPHDMPFIMKALMTPIMTPIEIVGKITKPFALTVRLFANMISGHVIILALIGLVFMFGVKTSFIAPIGMAIGIMLLEILVAFIQAFIFSLLAAVFIGQIRTAHH
ncbi:MAG TPA: F0F1 ATP synthase subunit A [Gemmatimonadaceae bacterium]|nr:F0F1 ATP synthase subunit A [Gemmatimonadaceae bacterium]